MAECDEISFPLLVTDCSAPGVRVGILAESGWLAYEKNEGETGAVLFQAIKQVLSTAHLSLKNIGSFAFCEGPGSTLGIRINAMALRTWTSLAETEKQVFAYRSLNAAAILINHTQPDVSVFCILSDLRKNSWNGSQVISGNPPSNIEVVSREAIDTWPMPRYFIQQRIHSPGLPPDSTRLEYDLEPIGNSQSFLDLLKLVEMPTVFQTTNTQFKKWVPTRHR
jgi:hypothetical protein